jgi:ribonuclease P/MRP protein subunit POP5
LLKRTKRRYLALEIDSAETFESKEFADGIWSAITRLYGEHGASQTGLVMIHCDMERKFAVIRVTNAASDMVRAALATITKIGDKPSSIHVIAASGTIKALQDRLKQR